MRPPRQWLPAHRERRRHVAERVDDEAGDHEHHGPEPGLRDGGRHHGEAELREAPRGLRPLGQVGDDRGRGSVNRHAEQQKVQAWVARQKPGDEAPQREGQRLGEDAEHDCAPDHAAPDVVDRGFTRQPEAETVHQHRAAEQQHRVEQQRQQHHGGGFADPDVAVGTSQHRAARKAVDQDHRGAARRREPQQVTPSAGHLPHAESVVARNREDGDDQRVQRHRARPGRPPRLRPLEQGETAGAEQHRRADGRHGCQQHGGQRRHDDQQHREGFRGDVDRRQRGSHLSHAEPCLPHAP